jgi:serine protease Do
VRRRLKIAAALVILLGGGLPLPAGAAWANQPDSSIADVVSRVQDSVVRIVVVHRAPKAPSASASGKEVASDQDAKSLTGIASGFVIDPRGYIATNRHVVENALAIFVGTQDGNRFRASIVGMPSKADIALLKISPDSHLPALSFGDSDKLRAGDTVIAIGNPFGFANSVSAGIVSSVNRNIMESPFDDYIQTDAAINHGNSGGPLFNLQGQVVGMTSVLFAPGHYSGSAGVGFAIPSNDLSFVFARLEKYGEVRAGMIPVRTQGVSALMAQAIGAPEPGGALVVQLGARGDALHGQLHPGDIIHAFNGQAVTDPRDFNRLAAKAAIGSTAHLSLLRAGRPLQVDVTVLPLEQTSAPPEQPEPPPTTLGIDFGQPKPGEQGVPVVSVNRHGSAADSGLQDKDVVLRVDQEVVSSPDQAMQAIEACRAKGRHLAALLVTRDGAQSWVPVAIPR